MRRLLASWWIVLLLSLAGILVTLPAHWSVVNLKITDAFRQLNTIRTALDLFKDRHERYPSTEEGLASLYPEFVTRALRDPWGNVYVYRASEEGTYVLYSVGVDGQDSGGAGDDVTNEQKKYECSTYGIDCAARKAWNAVALVSLILFLASALVGLVRGVWYVLRPKAGEGGIEA